MVGIMLDSLLRWTLFMLRCCLLVPSKKESLILIIWKVLPNYIQLTELGGTWSTLIRHLTNHNFRWFFSEELFCAQKIVKNRSQLSLSKFTISTNTKKNTTQTWHTISQIFYSSIDLLSSSLSSKIRLYFAHADSRSITPCITRLDDLTNDHHSALRADSFIENSTCSLFLLSWTLCSSALIFAFSLYIFVTFCSICFR